MTFSEKILEEGREEGRKEGEKEGEKKARRETAKKMKQDGLSPDIISNYTGLSKDEIEKL